MSRQKWTKKRLEVIARRQLREVFAVSPKSPTGQRMLRAMIVMAWSVLEIETRYQLEDIRDQRRIFGK